MLPDLRQPVSDLLAALGEQHVVAFFLVLARLSPLFLLAPLFSARFAPPRVRGIIAVSMALGLAPVLSKGALIPVDIASVFGLIIKELLIGALYAFVLGALYASITVAGSFLDVMIGFSFGGSVDPVNGMQSSVLTTAYGLFAIMIFIVIGGDGWILAGLVKSYDVVGMTELPSLALSVQGALNAFAGIFVSALQIAGPVMLALVLTDAAFGVVSRVMPQLNVFAVGFPAKIVIGLVLVSATLPFVGGWVADRLHEDVGTALHSLRVG